MTKIVKKFLPAFLLQAYRSWRYSLSINQKKFRGKSVAEIFNEIHEVNYWRGGQSVSGPGSDLSQTETIRNALPGILKKYKIKTLLDLPCGDFNWMQHVDLQGVDYIGADIVQSLVEQNIQKFSSKNCQFLTLNLLTDDLPMADLVLVRDCLVHFSSEHVFQALENLKKSGSRFLLTTSFSGERNFLEIETGGWRPLNLQKPPFNFPPPLEILNENCTEAEGAYSDKCLMLWSL